MENQNRANYVKLVATQGGYGDEVPSTPSPPPSSSSPKWIIAKWKRRRGDIGLKKK